MKQITCPHCGDTYPDFDAAHVCSKGPYAVKLKPKMNERIRELMEQAGAVFTDYHAVSLVDDEIEKFAELIVRECADYIDGSPTTDAGQLLLSKSFIIANLKGHFGVE